MLFYTIYNSPVGKIFIIDDNGFITHISFYPSVIDNAEPKITHVLQTVCKQLDEYFSHKRTVFDLPIAPHGTQFQQKVWQELLNIPYGQTTSYLKIAEKLYSRKYCRSIGQANNKNPIAIVIPCHRVVGHTGNLIGYAGGLHIKQYLLNLEGKFNA